MKDKCIEDCHYYFHPANKMQNLIKILCRKCNKFPNCVYEFHPALKPIFFFAILFFFFVPIFKLDKYNIIPFIILYIKQQTMRERAKEHLYANFYAFFLLVPFFSFFILFSRVFLLRRWKCVFYFYIYFLFFLCSFTMFFAS